MKAGFDIKDMHEVSGLCHGQESAIRAEAQRPNGSHSATQNSQALAWLSDVPYPCCCVLHMCVCRDLAGSQAGCFDHYVNSCMGASSMPETLTKRADSGLQACLLQNRELKGMEMHDLNQSTDQSTGQGARLSAMPVAACLYGRGCC